MGVLSAGVCYVELHYLKEPVELSNVVHSLLGFVLSLFLVFRTNTAYDRWWEGRKQWGGLVNVSRTLAVRVREFSKDDASWAFFQVHIPGFVDALRDHLRPNQPGEPARPEDGCFAPADHAPNAWAQAMEREAMKRLEAGEWTPQQHWLVSKTWSGWWTSLVRVSAFEDPHSIQLQHVHEEIHLPVCGDLALGVCDDVWLVGCACGHAGVSTFWSAWSSLLRRLRIRLAWMKMTYPWTTCARRFGPTPTKF